MSKSPCKQNIVLAVLPDFYYSFDFDIVTGAFKVLSCIFVFMYNFACYFTNLFSLLCH